MLAALALSSLLALPCLANNGTEEGKDKFFGKALTPTNYTVVPGIFIQDDPSFTGKNYSMLKDSFGLIDKSENRWTNLTE